MTSYLSLVPVRHLRRPGFSDCADSRHREVMSLFGDLPGPDPRSNNGILFRLELIPGKEPSYLIRSKIQPERLSAIEIAPKEEADPNYPPGTVVNFRVALNAVRRSIAGKSIPVPNDFYSSEDDDGELATWVSEKLSPFFSDVQIISHRREVLGGSRPGLRPAKVIQIDTVDGVASVRDGDALARGLTEGVGRGKSYGCGLLTVLRI